jgi:cellulose synthase/poly-beta-1,6-N-acetylglucosamine synthase-like glycosyltransferase
VEPIAHYLLVAYLGVLGLLAGAGAHRLWLLHLLRRPAPRRLRSLPADLPRVTVQLPVYNERHVIARLIDAACSLDWPWDRLEVQVLDDSTDATREIAAAAVAAHRAVGFPIVHLPRESRLGYKAGALAAGLERASGEFLAVFDADFLPAPDFLRQTVPAFADPTVGMVQARWGHLNGEEGLLARLQATVLDGHFLVDHAARERGDLLFNFNGTAGIWRRTCLVEAGGWQSDTVTEDLDLSYRAQLHGWRFAYAADVVVPGELPGELAAFKAQQHRWAKGSIQTLRKLAPSIRRARLPLRRKIEAFLHLGENAAYPLLLLLAVLLLASLPARRAWGWPLVAVEMPLFLLGTGSVTAFYLTSQRLAGTPALRRWGRILGVVALGIGLTVNNGRAVIEGLLARGGPFRRTPKVGDPGGTTAHYVAPADPLVLLEAGLAITFVGAGAWALETGTFSALPFLALYAAGFGGVAVAQAAQWIGRRAHPLRRRDAATASPT